MSCFCKSCFEQVNSVGEVTVKIAVVGLRGLDTEGGIESFCRYIYPSIIDLDHEVVFYTRKKYGVEKTWMRQRIVSLMSIHLKGVETLSYSVLASVHAILFERVDVVHIQALGPCLLLPLFRLYGKAIVVRHVGADWKRPKWGWVGSRTLLFAEKLAARFAHVVVCLNETEAKAFSERTNASAKIRVIPNAVPISTPRLDASWLEAVGLSSQKYILTVSRISEEKGIARLITAFDDANLADRGYKLAIAGEIVGRDGYKRKVRQLAARVPGVVLLGQMCRDGLPILYGGARIFVNASTHEGMSFSALEALSYGCACLFSDIPANHFKVNSIRWFDHTKPEALTQALSDMVLADPMSDDDRAAQQRDLNLSHNLKTTALMTVSALETAVQYCRACKEPVSLAGPKEIED